MLVLCVLVGLTHATLDDDGRQALFARVKHSVVVLQQTTATGERRAHGTGWVARADGWVVTNSHVAELGEGLTALFSDGKSVRVLGVLVDDPEHDIALLKIDATGLVPMPLSAVSEPAEGSTIFVVGNPLGYDFTVGSGLVAAYRKNGLPSALQTMNADKHATLQLQVSSAAGASGSPVFDDSGQVLGVVRAGVGVASTMVFAVPVEFVRPMLQGEHAIVKKRVTSEQVPWVNAAISVGVFAAAALLFRWLTGKRQTGPARPTRKWSGYEE